MANPRRCTPANPSEPSADRSSSSRRKCADTAAVARLIRRRYDEAKEYLTGAARYDLQAWLADTEQAAGAREVLAEAPAWRSQPDRQLVSLQLVLAPGEPPVFLGREVSASGLRAAVAATREANSDAGEWITQLRTQRILTLVHRHAGLEALGVADEHHRM